MKYLLIKIILILSILSFLGISNISNTYAAEGDKKSANGVSIIVTEKIPGANCKENTGTPEFPRYKCTVQKGFGTVIIMMGKIIKYFTYITSLGAVLFIVINGILYSMGGAEPSMKDDAKKRITGTLIGLVLLFLSGVILNMIAPWIYK